MDKNLLCFQLRTADDNVCFGFGLNDFQIPNELKSEIIESLQNEINIVFVQRLDYAHGNAQIPKFQRNNPEIRNRIRAFQNLLEEKYPQIRKILPFFNAMQEDELFFFSPKVDIPFEEISSIDEYLKSQKLDIQYQIYISMKNAKYENVLDEYSLVEFKDNEKYFIGKDQNCRFCNKDKTKTTFKNKSHAISEAFGNKNIICRNECDNCNNEFGKNIEQDLINYLRFFRDYYGIAGKKSDNKYIGKNFELIKSGDKLKLSYKYNIEKEKNNTSGFIKLLPYEKIIPQKIYKTLCKYFLSTIDDSFIPCFKETINWINGCKSSQELPKIAVSMSKSHFTKRARIKLYLRKNRNYNLPFAVGEFNFTVIKYIFIVPFSNQDSCLFIKDEDFNRFWLFFQNYSYHLNCDFVEFNDTEKVNPYIEVNKDILNFTTPTPLK
ncbi:MAG: HNH endonuclease [Paludibacteraceae bacterium]|nr:HNH endonuclease [Paludibacteraceae bacterium]